MKSILNMVPVTLLATVVIVSCMERKKEAVTEEPIQEVPDASGDGLLYEDMDSFEYDMLREIEEGNAFVTDINSVYDLVEKRAQKRRGGAPMSTITKCKYAWKFFKRSKCETPKVDFARQVSVAIGSAAFNASNGDINTPKIAFLKNEMSRLNTLIATYHARNQAFCNKMGSLCDDAKFMYLCNTELGRKTDDVIKKRYENCGALLKDDESNFLAVLKEIGVIVNNFQDKSLSSDSTQIKVKNSLDKINLIQ